MPVKTQKGSAWVAGSGSATAGNSGLNVLSGSPNYGAANVTLPDGTSTAYITWAENTSGTFRLDAAYSSDLGSADQGVTVFFWLRLRKTTAASYAADNTSTGSSAFIRFIDGSSKLRWYFDRIRNRASATFPATIDGLSGILSSGMGGTTTAEVGMNAASDPPAFPLGVWMKFGVRIFSGRTTGTFSVSMNHQTIGLISGLALDPTDPAGNVDDATHMTNTSLQGDWTMTLPAIAGCTWDLGPLESWTDTGTPDHGYSPVTAWGWFNSSDTLKQYHGCTYRSALAGRYWQEVLTTGAPTFATVEAFAASAFQRRHVSMTGVDTEVATLQGNHNIGALSYGANGWAHVHFPILYFPDLTSGLVTIRDTGDTTDVATIALNGTNIVVNGQTITTHTKTHSYSVTLSFNSSGEMRAWVHDLGTLAGAARDWTAKITNGWTVQALGKCNIKTTFSGSATSRTDGLAVMSLLELSGIDSYSHTQVDFLASGDSSTIGIGAENHYSQVMGWNRMANLIPGSAYRLYELSQPRRWFIPIGYTGQRLATHVANHLPQFDALRGARYWGFGWITNDINLGTATEAGMNTVMTNAIADATTLINYWTSRGSYVVVADALVWNFETTLDGTTIKADRSGSTVTVTCANHGYTNGMAITFLEMSNSALDKQAATITYINANSFSYTTSTSGSVTGASGKMRYFNDVQIETYREFQLELRRLAAVLQYNSLVSWLPIGSGIPVSAKAFSLGFTTEVHPSDAKKFLAVDYAVANTRVGGTVQSPTVQGWSKNSARRRVFGLT